MTKLIGIVGSIGNNNVFGQKAYINYFKHFGNIIVINPRQDTIIPQLDLLVLPGGLDVSPYRYKEISDPELCGEPNPWFEWFDMVVLPKYIDNKIPIYGICRGMQTLNVHFGGTLHQNIENHPYSTKSRDELVHSVFDNITNKIHKVNSLHHQAVKVLGNDLIPILTEVVRKSDTALIESFAHKTLPIYGEQFHPEELYSEYSINKLNLILDGIRII